MTLTTPNTIPNIAYNSSFDFGDLININEKIDAAKHIPPIIK